VLHFDLARRCVDVDMVFQFVQIRYLAAGQVAQGVSGEVSAAGNYGTDLGSSQTAMLAAQDIGMPAATSTLGSIAGNVAATAVTGGDPLAALISGGVGAGVNELTSKIDGFSSTAQIIFHLI